MNESMDPSVERLVSALETIGQTLDTEAMCPDPDAKAWDVRQLQELWRRIQEDCAPALDELEGSDVLPPDQVAGAKRAVAGFAVEVATLGGLISDVRLEREAQTLAESLAPDDVVEEIRAAARDRASYGRLMLARWHQRRNDWSAGDRALRAIQTSDETLTRAVQDSLKGPRPLTGGAPSLYTLNGFGLMLYGNRDAREDGTHVATHTLTALFVPFFPLAAYRVLPRGADGWYFLSKEPLSAFAIWWRRFIIAAAALGFVALFVASWWNAPGNRAERELDALALLEGDEAVQAYGAFVSTHAYDAPDASARAATRLAEMLIARVAEPLTLERIDEAQRVALRIEALEAGRLSTAPQMYAALGRWAEQVGAEDLAHAEARAELVAIALRFAGPQLEQAQAAAREADMAVAQELEADWPLAALRRYGRHVDSEDAAGHFAELVTRVQSPEALLELDDSAHAFLQRYGTVHSEAGEHVRTKLDDARLHAADPDRLAALQSEVVDELRAQLERFPGDHSLLAALGHALRATSTEESLALWTEIPPGMMSSLALESYAFALRDAGRLQEADALLTRHVRELLPAYQEASRALDGVVSSIVEELDRKIDRGEYPPQLDVRLRGATSDEEARAIYSEYVREQLNADSRLTDLRARTEATSGVVRSALGLAMVKLQRAEGSDPIQREGLLAEAEQLFLSIRQQAEGAPEYHLGLGRVYHRMGRIEEGDRELAQLATQGATMQLMVARIYRDLGLDGQSRRYAQSAFDGGAVSDKGEAAIILSLLATDLDDEERWLRLAPQDAPFVINGLASLRAQRAFAAGDLDDAARIYSEVAARFEEDAAGNESSSNNAAVAYQHRYECTGDPADLERATRLLERAMRQAPDTALVVGNLAASLGFRGRVRVLDRYVRTSVIRPGRSQARSLLAALLRGPKGDEVEARLLGDASIRRSIELWRQMRVLAPGTSTAHEEELWMCELADDQACIDQLHARVLSHTFHDADALSRYARWVGGDDPEAARVIRESLTTAQRVVQAAEASRHAPTIAAARMLAIDAVLSDAVERSDLEGLRAAASNLDDLEWNEGNTAVMHAGALLQIALLESRNAPALAQALDQDGRALGSLLFMKNLLWMDAWSDAVRAQPSARRAIEVLQSETKPSADLWAVAQALGDDALAERMAAFRESPLPIQIRAHLQPWRRDRLARVELLDPSSPTSTGQRAGSSSQAAQPAVAQELVLDVAAEHPDVGGIDGVSEQRCLRVREPGFDWMTYCGQIVGFEPQRGTAYRVRVRRIRETDVPLDVAPNLYEHVATLD